MGLGATILTFSPGTTIKSSDTNTNNNALNGATNPSFSGLTVTGPSSLDSGKMTTDGNGNLTLGNINFGQAVGGAQSNLRNDTTFNTSILQSPAGTVNTGILFETHTAPSTTNVPFSIGGQIASSLAWVNNDGSLQVPKITLSSGSTFTRLSTFSASGISGGVSTAINHGLGAVPAGCAICPNLGNGSATIGAGSFTSTQVTVTIGNSGSGPWAVMGIAWA